MSVLDDVFAALARPANGGSVVVNGVATLTGKIAFIDDDAGSAAATCNIIATGVLQTASLTYAPALAGGAPAVRFAMPLHYVWPANFLAAEPTAITLTKHPAAVPSYTIDFNLPWTDVAFTANVDTASGVIYGSANDALIALALCLEFEPQRKRRKPLEVAVTAGRPAPKRAREPRRP